MNKRALSKSEATPAKASKRPRKAAAAREENTAAPELSPVPFRVLGTAEAIRVGFENHLRYTLAKNRYTATDHDRYYALAMTIRDRLVDRWMRTSQTYFSCNVKRVYYLSMEYLIGRAMGNNVVNLRMDREVTEAMAQLGLQWDHLRDIEPDAGLGHGGLGRLAACFLDSMATLELPGYGYGLRYDYGIFRQTLRDGHQVEEPDNWLRHGNPWEIERPEYQFAVRFGGKVIEETDAEGRFSARWVNGKTVLGVPYDFPIAGYATDTVNNLRLWAARATEEFDLAVFNSGDYIKAYEQKVLSENITRVLYPSDQIEQGRELRFQQQYFFVSCSLQDILRRFKAGNTDIRTLPDRVAIQINDTHPSLAVVELMRLLLDVERLDWETAWEMTRAIFGYTNHTLMPEALEQWPERMFAEILPRHLSILYEINRRFLRRVMNRFPDDHDRLRRMSLIAEGPERRVRMAHLAVVGSHCVNGVSALHTELLRRHVLKDFHDLEPDLFRNVTNGITPRRWLLKSNPGLAALITERIGDGWVKDLDRLRELEPHAADPEFLRALGRVKRANKERLAQWIRDTQGVVVDPDSLFDAQIKRLHEYKRQLLNVLHVAVRYFRLKEQPGVDVVPRTVLFAGKAAPGYTTAKLIIKLINDLAAIVNRDPDVNDRLRVVFLPDYRVSLAERVIPASDLSEQISTAGTEASGTGNMKFMLNGALTIGTLDGANIEIREAVGPENFFHFGHSIEGIQALQASGEYDPWKMYHENQELRRVLDALRGDFFDLERPGLFAPLWDALLTWGDRYFHLADFADYAACQQRVDETYRQPSRWQRMCAMNIARSGRFSSDRAVLEYAREVWGIRPCPVQMETEKILGLA